jgi:quinohemoprotein ethanol dehydrogenase
MAAPMSYAVNGVQYVAVQVGYGGGAITVGPTPPSSAALKYQNVNRIIVFKLDGGPVPAPPVLPEEPFPKPPPRMGNPASLKAGEIKFVQECSRCHVLGPSITPDLRKLSPAMHQLFKDIVLRGAVAPTGMERFDDLLSEADADDIHAYIIDEGWKAYQEQQSTRAH